MQKEKLKAKESSDASVEYLAEVNKSTCKS